MKLIKLLGIGLLSMGMLFFTGCSTDSDDPDPNGNGDPTDVGVDDTDVGEDLDTGNGGQVDTEDTSTTPEEQDVEVDDRTELEIFCDNNCEFMVDCWDELEIEDEIDMEECVDECLGYINDLSENKPEGCAEATIEYYNCGLELSCADANSMFTDGEDADLSEDHACYTELVNSNNICNPLSPEEQIAGYCESLCAISMTCQEEDEEEEESEQSVEEEMGQCLMFCQAVYGSLVSRSSDCFDAFAELSECVADNEDCEMFGYEEEETEGACTDKITALDAVCCPMVIFADECEELCQHLNDCEADDYEECMEYCVAVNHLVAALDDEDCAAAYQAYTSCLMDAECSDLITEEEEEQVCDDERVAYDELCDNYT